jgi:hypothetical protein
MTTQEHKEYEESREAFCKFLPKAIAAAVILAWALPHVVSLLGLH